MLVQYFVPHLTFLYEPALAWTRIILAFALVLGILSLVNVHLARVRRKTMNWQYSIITLSGLTFMLLAGFLTKYDAFESAEQSGGFVYFLSKLFDFDALFLNVQIPIQATMFSLLAFYIASAAFRAFRARTFESTLLLVAATIVMIGRVPIGTKIPCAPTLGFLLFFLIGIGVGRLFKKRGMSLVLHGVAVAAVWFIILLIYYEFWRDLTTFQDVTAWILDVPNTAAKRGIMIGVGLGMTSTAIKIVLGIERTYLGGKG